MDITTPFLTIAQLGLVPLVMAVVAIFKSAGVTGEDHRWAPLISLLLGTGSAFLLPSVTWQLTVLAGLTIGTLAAGVYSGVKATVAPNS